VNVAPRGSHILQNGPAAEKVRNRWVKPIWILMRQEMMGWQLHQLDRLQIICTSLQTDKHASISSFVFTGRMIFMTPSQQYQCTKGTACFFCN